MINSIKIKNIASFCETGVSIDNLKKINFIYGANGCGKTTVSNFLFETAHPFYFKSYISWKNELQIDSLVYNKRFREENFGKGEISGVFTLGKATKEQIEEIEKKKDHLTKRKLFGEERRKSLTKLIEDKIELDLLFKEDCWKLIYKKYEKSLKEAFRGNIKDKESFKNKLVSEYQSNESDLLSQEVLFNKAETILNTEPKHIDLLSNIDFQKITQLETNSIWEQKIIGKADVKIANLINHLNISDWVNEGRSYIDKQNDTCPFCQSNTINEIFRKDLESFFDLSYTTDIDSLKHTAEQYRSGIESLINQLIFTEDTQKQLGRSKLSLELYSPFLRTIISKFQTNLEKINSKLKEPSRSVELGSLNGEFEDIKEVIERANTLIRENNSLVVNYITERDKLTSEAWKFVCNEFEPNIQTYLGKDKGLSQGIQKLDEDIANLIAEYKELRKEIITLGKTVTSVQPTIDEINRILRGYGFSNFQIIPSQQNENQYQIIREDGNLAESTLSEGEVTFITFLYYLQLTKGGTSEENVSNERILVIDDPISSLDSNVLYVISSLIKEIIKDIKADRSNIKQLILLTHNVYFHKEVSFVDGRKDKSNSINYYILRKRDNITQIQDFGSENPIHSSYELLWNELKNHEKNCGITIQNTMRRIIENYFRILGKYGDDYLISRFQSQEEREICRSLICWINDGSHTLPDDLFIEHQDAVIDKYFNVFKGIFEHSNHIEHYNMMMGVREEEISLVIS
ncbi:AAA family ATPase [Pedobacter sp. P351]|uniref:AAA family ATPase n=1 Tax=Pedobacter superstes TaxID=3133441 RepID=UPI0030AEF462